MNAFLIVLPQVDIEKKLEEAPDAAYSIGIFIGNMLPFVILVLIAYAIFRYNKKRIKDD